MDTQGPEPDTKMNAALAATLRAERGAARVTIKQLMEATGIPKSTMLRLLNNQRPIDVDHLAMLSRALGIPSARLMESAQRRLDEGGTTTGRLSDDEALEALDRELDTDNPDTDPNDDD